MIIYWLNFIEKILMYKKPGYFCKQPFTYTEVQPNFIEGKDGPLAQYLCCPNWNNTVLGTSENLKENWNSKEAEEVRNEMLKGNFKNCEASNCPSLNTFIKNGKVHTDIYPIEMFDKIVGDYSVPKVVRIANDFACNLQCPSCRLEFIPNSKQNTENINKLFNNIEKYFSNGIETISVSGAGDPFYSNPIREFLFNFNEKKYPTFKRLSIVTNGIMFTPKSWEKMKNIRKYISDIEVSIDAAKKDTYENKVRLRGNWDTLIENLNFLSSLDEVPQIYLSFVAQKDNYREMEDFVKLGCEIFKKHKRKGRLFLKFYRIVDWATNKEHGYNSKNICNVNHPEYKNFELEANKLTKYVKQNFVVLNFNDHTDG